MKHITTEYIKGICETEILPMWERQPITMENLFPESYKVSEEQKKTNEEQLQNLMVALRTHMAKNPQGREQENAWRAEADQLLLGFVQARADHSSS